VTPSCVLPKLIRYNKDKIKHLTLTKTKDNLTKEVKISSKPNISTYHNGNEAKGDEMRSNNREASDHLTDVKR
jgi:hypothetical protein